MGISISYVSSYNFTLNRDVYNECSVVFHNAATVRDMGIPCVYIKLSINYILNNTN
ncbi:MAG: hypothetical protein K0R50_4756 [Eubacterium sp.]|jgi:hypothetical protein|nr:hypothetical protein [Eubacterium sp.]